MLNDKTHQINSLKLFRGDTTIMTDIEKCQLVWRGKSKGKHELKLLKSPYLLQVIESINNTMSIEGWRNKLIFGENKIVMASLLEDFAGKINLIYIDPPFASGSIFKTSIQIEEDQEETLVSSSPVKKGAFKDTWGRGGLSSYLQMMYERLMLIRELLAKNGSIFVHLDWHTSHYVKVILDEIFGYENFRADIIWQRTPGHHLSSTMDVMTDVILWYSKTADYVYHQQYQSLTDKEEEEKFSFFETETGRRFTHENLNRARMLIVLERKEKLMVEKLRLRWVGVGLKKRLTKD